MVCIHVFIVCRLFITSSVASFKPICRKSIMLRIMRLCIRYVKVIRPFKHIFEGRSSTFSVTALLIWDYNYRHNHNYNLFIFADVTTKMWPPYSPTLKIFRVFLMYCNVIVYLTPRYDFRFYNPGVIYSFWSIQK